MFFPEKIVSIKDTDRVLEIGPGGTPYYRSDVLLEKIFSEEDAREQRGHTEALKTDQKLVFYEGERFPFDDNEFDYVVCSHVLEHIPSENIENFVAEIQRVGKKGYLEFPTIYYDYIYNFPKHLTFLLYEDGVIKYLGKEKTQLELFSAVQKFFYNSADAGYTCLTRGLKDYYFQGFEWNEKIILKKVDAIDDIVYSHSIIDNIKKTILQETSCKQKIKSKIKSKLQHYKKMFLLYVLRDKFLNAHKKWVELSGDKTLRLNYDLSSESIVFDLGGYKGDFAQNIYDKYGCTVYVFEPVASFYNHIVDRFYGNDKIKVFNFGLSDSDCTTKINLEADGSSVFTDSDKKETIVLKDISSFLNEESILKIDLMKINIEGGEFQVLPALIENGYINKIVDLQVQFHTFVDNAKKHRDVIRRELSKTHRLTYDYWFIWENWTLKS